MTPETAAALKAASHNLIIESGYASTDAANARADMERNEKRAAGFREAAAAIDALLAEGNAK